MYFIIRKSIITYTIKVNFEHKKGLVLGKQVSTFNIVL